MWPFPSRPQPPIPQRILQLLQDYPSLIKRLQESLDEVVTKPIKTTPPFEVAMWALEDTLGGFLTEARKELAIAKGQGDHEKERLAEKKIDLLFSSKSQSDGLLRVSELESYFSSKEALR